MESKRYSLNKEQQDSLKRAMAKYIAPLLLVFLLAIQQGTPVVDALWIVYGAALQLTINFLSKFVTETK